MKKISLSFLILIHLTLLGQDLKTFIPNTASMVAAFNGSSINNKYPLEKLEEMEMFFELKKQLKRSFFRDNDIDQVSLKDFGIDHSQKSYFFMEMSDSANYMQFIFPVNNATALKKVVQETQEEEITKDNDGFYFQVKKDVAVKWNDTYGILLKVDDQSSYFRNNNSIYANYGIEIDSNAAYWNLWDERKTIVGIWAKQRLEKIKPLDGDKLLLNTPSFKAAKLEKYDISFWMNTEQFFNGYLQSMSKLSLGGEDDLIKNAVNELFKDDAAWYGLTFKNGQIEVRSESFLNKKTRKYVSEVQKAKVNKKFASFTNQDNPLAYYGFAFNPKNLLDGFHDYYADIVNSFPYGPIVNDVWKLVFDVLIDEEALFEVFRGDFLLLLNDIRPVEVAYSTYTYDEDFNSTEVEKTKIEERPIVTFMMSTKQEPAEKILDLSLLSRKIQKKDGYYEINKDVTKGVNIYLAVKEGILVASNDLETITKISSEQQVIKLNKKHASAIRKNNSTLYVDMKSILKKIPTREKMNEKEGKTYDNFLNSSQKIEQKGFKKTKNGFYSTMTVDFGSEDVNSYEFLMKFINDLYKIDKGME